MGEVRGGSPQRPADAPADSPAVDGRVDIEVSCRMYEQGSTFRTLTAQTGVSFRVLRRDLEASTTTQQFDPTMCLVGSNRRRGTLERFDGFPRGRQARVAHRRARGTSDSLPPRGVRVPRALHP